MSDTDAKPWAIEIFVEVDWDANEIVKVTPDWARGYFGLSEHGLLTWPNMLDRHRWVPPVEVRDVTQTFRVALYGGSRSGEVVTFKRRQTKVAYFTVDPQVVEVYALAGPAKSAIGPLPVAEFQGVIPAEVTQDAAVINAETFCEGKVSE